MKTLVLAITAVLLLSFGFQNQNKDLNGKNNPDSIFPKLNCPNPPSFSETMKNEAKKKDLQKDENEIDQNWYQKAIKNIKNEEYNITYSDELGAYQSPNRENNIRFIYHKDGFTAVPRDARRETKDVKRETENDWSIDFKTQSVNSEWSMVKSELKVDGSKAFIENEKMRIDYTNTKDGMRQDFIVKNKPEGEGKLRLNLSADTKLKMIVGADALMFKDEDGIDKMKYSALKCWDANGKVLRAYFETTPLTPFVKGESIPNPISQIPNQKNQKSSIPAQRGEKDQKSFAIVVNDEDAVYPVTIDPLSASPNWTSESDQISALYGISVSTAGDVNGDGFSDVIIGSPNYDNGQNDEGRVYVYYGTATGLPATANWTAESNQATASFGESVSTSGDVNGDGYSDIIVGSRRYTNGQNNEGAAFGWYGSSSGLNSGTNGTPSNCAWNVESNEISANMGNSVSTAGDVNGDGYSDVIVGIRYKDVGFSDEGAAYVYYGSASGTVAAPTWTAALGQADANFGWSVSTAGDVNGDGYSDIMIGAPFYDNGSADEGEVFVWLGSSTGLGANGTFTNSDWEAEANQVTAKLGFSVSTAGDVNGDGYSDILIGAPEFDNGSADEGIVLLFLGSTSPLLGVNGTPANANWSAESNQVSANFGYSVGVAGDVNGDGYSDVVIGSPLYDNTLADEGGIFLFYGSSADLGAYGTPVNAGFKYYSAQLNAQIGTSIFTAGDVNGDGFSDVIAGAYLYDNGQADEGRAYLFNGAPTGLSLTQNWGSESDQIDANFGFSVSSAGDVNGDDYADVVIGAPYYDNVFVNNGRIYVYHGSSTGLPAVANFFLNGGQNDANFGSSVSTAGDFNGDGYSDVIVGIPNFDNGNTDEGRVIIYRGSSTGVIASYIFLAEGNQDSAFFGANVSTAGDVNGDGYSDVIIGAQRYDSGQVDEGKVFVYYGSPSGAVGTPWTAESNQAGASFGDAVSTAGDVNGDGYSDILIGASRYDNGQTDEGSAFLYYGSATGLSNTSDWTAESNDVTGRMGYSVSTAGDINGDGYADIIVGAALYTNGKPNEGGIFVWNGSSTGLGANGTPGNADWSAESDQSYAQLGYSVSNAGDVNGDGYSDIIAGARFYDNGQNSEGKIFLWNGSSTGLGSDGTPGNADWSFESNQADANLGNSVAGAGDVNGDGYSDVIAGASDYDNGQLNEGLVYAFYGNGGTGLKSTLQQFGATTSRVCSSGGLTSISGKATLQLFGKSIYGRADGRMSYEIKENGVPFSGIPITNSVSSTGLTALTDLGTTVSGIDIISIPTGLLSTKEYKWRARVEYRPANNPFQKNGPWKYYTNYISNPFGCFKSINYDSTAPATTFTNIADTSSLSNRTLSNVVITDAGGVQGASGIRPRIYYKKKSGSNTFNDNTNATVGWKYAEATGATSPFSFTINYSLLFGSVFYGDTVQYFITAQDVRGIGPSNVGITTGTLNAEQFSVALASNAFPISGTIKSYKITDNVAPVISYSNITDTTSLSNRAFNNVVITDSSGIQGSTGFRPRVYYKRKTDANTFNDNTNATTGWKYSTASGSTSPFSFTINYNRLNGSIAENDTVQYFIVAQDKYTPPFVAINSGTFAASPSSVDLTSAAFPVTGSINSYTIIKQPKSLFLTTLIQGFYDAGSDIMIADSVTVYLRNNSAPYAIIDTSKILLGTGALARGSGSEKDASGSSTGFGVCSFLNASNGVPYYIQISHRNSIETWSGTAQSFVLSQLIYDFTTSANQAFGDNMILVNTSPVRFAMFGGDVNQDGTIDASDVSTVDNDSYSSLSGYVQSDLTGDDFVDAGDVSIVDNNAAASVSAITP